MSFKIIPGILERIRRHSFVAEKRDFRIANSVWKDKLNARER